MPTVSYGIAATADDGCQVGSFGFFDTNPGAGYDSGSASSLSVGFRFLSVAVPQGATITSASLTLKTDSGFPATGSAWGTIKGVAADNAPPWTTTDPAAASKTTQSTTITSDAIKAYDVTAIVQAIVNRTGWASGNALAFAGDPTGANGYVYWIDRAASAVDCAQLSITYLTGPSVPVATPAAATHGHTATSPSLTATGGTSSVTPSAATHAHTATQPTVANSSVLDFLAAATGTTTATMPAHQAGDLIVAFAFRDGSNTQPTIPAANWSTLQNATDANTCSHVLVAKVATSSAETVGTFTNATSVVVQIYRPKTGYTLSVGANATQTGTATSITYPAITLQDSGGDSWVAAFGGHRSVNTTLENPPTGMTQRATVLDATDEAAGFDTNGGVTAWTAQSVALGGTASGWRSSVVEIKAATAPNPSAGPDNAAQPQAATSPAFTAKSVISPDAAAQAHLTGSPNLSVGALSVAPTGASQSQTSTSPALASASAAAPSSAAQTQIATSPGLVGRSALIPAGSDHSQVATEPALAPRASTLPDGATHGQTAIAPALLFGASIQPNGARHDHNSSVPSLASRSAVAPQTATQAQEAATAALTPSGSLGVQSAIQGQAATPAVVVSRAAFDVDPATSGQSASGPNLTAAAAVAVEAGVSGQIATPAPITSRSVVAPNDAGQVNQSSLPTIVWRGDLPPVPPIRHVVLIGRRRTASLTARVRVASLTGRTRKIIR